jgi:hypothetical protein
MAALIHELEVHLLFVDDEASIAKMEGQALERPGYTVGDILKKSDNIREYKYGNNIKQIIRVTQNCSWRKSR